MSFDNTTIHVLHLKYLISISYVLYLICISTYTRIHILCDAYSYLIRCVFISYTTDLIRITISFSMSYVGKNHATQYVLYILYIMSYNTRLNDQVLPQRCQLCCCVELYATSLRVVYYVYDFECHMLRYIAAANDILVLIFHEVPKRNLTTPFLYLHRILPR